MMVLRIEEKQSNQNSLQIDCIDDCPVNFFFWMDTILSHHNHSNRVNIAPMARVTNSLFRNERLVLETSTIIGDEKV